MERPPELGAVQILSTSADGRVLNDLLTARDRDNDYSLPPDTDLAARALFVRVAIQDENWEGVFYVPRLVTARWEGGGLTVTARVRLDDRGGGFLEDLHVEALGAVSAAAVALLDLEALAREVVSAVWGANRVEAESFGGRGTRPSEAAATLADVAEAERLGVTPSNFIAERYNITRQGALRRIKRARELLGEG
jgi:hypothetical protein